MVGLHTLEYITWNDNIIIFLIYYNELDDCIIARVNYSLMKKGRVSYYARSVLFLRVSDLCNDNSQCVVSLFT